MKRCCFAKVVFYAEQLNVKCSASDYMHMYQKLKDRRRF